MIIHVTQTHIEQGRPGSIYGCPIALALHEQIKQHRINCSVDKDNLDFFIGYAKRTMNAPRSVRRFIVLYDDPQTRQKAKPFNFRLSLDWLLNGI